ncbi:MAG TPA: CPBP family intramembrane glutamic endopeptidase [Actinomycetes bacterium]
MTATQAPGGLARGGTAPVPPSALPVAAAGLGFLLLRPQIAALPLGRPALAAGYLALAAGAGLPAALRRPAAPEGPLAWPPVLGTGLVAVAAVALAVRPVPPAPAGAAAVLLGLAAAVAEEALFRQALYRLLAARGGVLLAVTGAALLFALVHLPFYGMAAFPVDLGAGLLFGWQRWASGSWTVPAATHAAANLMVVIRLG